MSNQACLKMTIFTTVIDGEPQKLKLFGFRLYDSYSQICVTMMKEYGFLEMCLLPASEALQIAVDWVNDDECYGELIGGIKDAGGMIWEGEWHELKLTENEDGDIIVKKG